MNYGDRLIFARSGGNLGVGRLPRTALARIFEDVGAWEARIRGARPLFGAVFLVSAIGCGSDGSAGAAGPGGPGSGALVRFVVKNDLSAPITVAIDDTVSLILTSGASSGLAVEPSAQWLSWTSAKPTDSAGTQIPDDIGRVLIRVSGIGGLAEITNVINDTTYVTAELTNPTSTRVSIGVYDGSSVACASVLHAASGGVPGFTKIGYYRLLPRTEIRAYHDGSNCTGAYVSWAGAQLAQFQPKSGIVSLTLATAP